MIGMLEKYEPSGLILFRFVAHSQFLWTFILRSSRFELKHETAILLEDSGNKPYIFSIAQVWG